MIRVRPYSDRTFKKECLLKKGWRHWRSFSLLKSTEKKAIKKKKEKKKEKKKKRGHMNT